MQFSKTFKTPETYYNYYYFTVKMYRCIILLIAYCLGLNLKLNALLLQ